MEALRFEKFTLLIDGIHKSIHKIKMCTAPVLGVKAVHVLWIYELLLNPEGLTAAELAEKSRINRSLVSRELEELVDNGYIEKIDEGRSNYNAVLKLTEQGIALADKICGEVSKVQSAVGEGISKEELAMFYCTLEKLNNNFNKIINNKSKRRKSE